MKKLINIEAELKKKTKQNKKTNCLEKNAYFHTFHRYCFRKNKNPDNNCKAVLCLKRSSLVLLNKYIDWLIVL